MSGSHGWTIWLTGPPAAGKTTLAQAIRGKLGQRGIGLVILDSDELRQILTPGAGYSLAERDRFYQALVDLAALLAGYGVNVIIAATAHRRAYRQYARMLLEPFAEVWVRCPAVVCRARDPKGLYARAAAGLIGNLPGADAAYEPPEAADAIVDTDQCAIEDAAEMVIAGVAFLHP